MGHSAPPSRTPPAEVRRTLRREVGFGCPIPDCRNPYLEYHHFDPPWATKHHHDPEGMIALCATHHAKAGAWTGEDLRSMKRTPPDAEEVQGRFEWMRREVLAIVGGGLYHETQNVVVFRDEPMVWFERDNKGRLLLSFRMLTRSGLPRTRLDNNDWLIRGNPTDVQSPPNGSSLAVKYADGDRFNVRFREWPTLEPLAAEYPSSYKLRAELSFPLVTAELSFKVGGSSIEFGPTSTQVGGIHMQGAVASRCGVGLAFS